MPNRQLQTKIIMKSVEIYLRKQTWVWQSEENSRRTVEGSSRFSEKTLPYQTVQCEPEATCSQIFLFSLLLFTAIFLFEMFGLRAAQGCCGQHKGSGFDLDLKNFWSHLFFKCAQAYFCGHGFIRRERLNESPKYSRFSTDADVSHFTSWTHPHYNLILIPHLTYLEWQRAWSESKTSP